MRKEKARPQEEKMSLTACYTAIKDGIASNDHLRGRERPRYHKPDCPPKTVYAYP